MQNNEQPNINANMAQNAQSLGNSSSTNTNTQNSGIVAATSPSLNTSTNSSYDPNNPPEFNPNANQPKVTKKHAISGLGIAVIIVGIVLLGLIVGKVIGLFVGATSYEDCRAKGYCKYGKYACSGIKECVVCNEKCKYVPTDLSNCEGLACNPTPTPTLNPSETPPPGQKCASEGALGTAKSIAAEVGNTGRCTCVGNNPICCYINSNGQKKCILLGDWGIQVSGPEAKCEAPFTWGPRLEYGKWWCFDTSRHCLPTDYTISGRCTSAVESKACTKDNLRENLSPPPSACFNNPPPPTAPPTTQPPTTVPPTTVPPTTQPPTTVPPTTVPPTTVPPTTVPPTTVPPQEPICKGLEVSENQNNNYTLTCFVNEYAKQCKYEINDNTYTINANSNQCQLSQDFAPGHYDIKCYAVDPDNNQEVTSEECTAQLDLETPTTPTPSVTVPNTGIMDSPIALASLTVIVLIASIFELFTGTITGYLLNTVSLGKRFTNPKDLRLRIKLSENSKLRKLLEQKILEDINNKE